MPWPDDEDHDEFERGIPPVVHTAASDRIVADMKRTMADPVAMAKVRQD